MRRTQPIGAFPFPAGLLLLPEAGADEVAEALLAGRLPAEWPASLLAHARAYAGDIDGALAAVDGEYAAFNRFVLGGGEPGPLPPHLAPLAELVGYINGDRATPPARPARAAASGGAASAAPPPPAPVLPEVEALIVAAHATEALAAGRPADAVALLREAAEVAPAAPLAAVLRGNAGTVAAEHHLDGAYEDLTSAAAALAGTDLHVSRAELHHQLGTLAHEQAAAAGGSLQGAMHHYYTALQLITRDDAPYLWASAQLNLATAYLATPMVEASDQLRMGIAIQALRASLEVFTREEHPAQWATATLDLANALVYTPSVKQGDNLVEAVELYEQVLEVRDRETDPAGRARVLANQGNALAHLGIFDQAKAKLVEARFLFEEQLDHGAVLAVRSVLDEIVKRSLAKAT